MIDVVTVWHKDDYRVLAEAVGTALKKFGEPHAFHTVDNSPAGSRSFSAACNEGARAGSADLILFLNPDVEIEAPFLGILEEQFDADPSLGVCGERFGKPASSWRTVWGCADWVCGACMCVRRSTWDKIGGFDEAYSWGWEETDFIREVQLLGQFTKSIPLPVRHGHAWDDSEEDLAVKRDGLNKGSVLFKSRWRANSTRRRR